jgi:DNA-binding Xre family transcriptional regulator
MKERRKVDDTMRVESNLKALLDDRGESIRSLTDRSGLHYESVRRLYNDTTTNYNRDTLARLCEVLDVGLCDLLIMNAEKRPNREG